MDNLFSSSRLIYRAVGDTRGDEDFVHTLRSDVNSQAGSDSALLKPMAKQESRKHMDYIANKTLLGAIICLAEPEITRSFGPTEPTPIGSIYLTAAKSGEEHHRHSYIRVDIISAYQRKGYEGEAIEWALDWGFRIAGLHRIGTDAFSYNQGARELYRNLGFVYEGCKREFLWFNGKWHDSLFFSILEHEWEARQKKKLESVSKDTKKE